MLSSSLDQPSQKNSDGKGCGQGRPRSTAHQSVDLIQGVVPEIPSQRFDPPQIRITIAT
jgi:hypothetical protein